jgi:hypothetical protein
LVGAPYQFFCCMPYIVGSCEASPAELYNEMERRVKRILTPLRHLHVEHKHAGRAALFVRQHVGPLLAVVSKAVEHDDLAYPSCRTGIQGLPGH